MIKSLLSYSLFLLLFFGGKFLSADQPNVVVILVDDLGYADLSFLPNASGDISTPAIDRLAEEGVYCSQAYATSPICSPSRTGLITGRYQTRWGNYWYSEGGLPAFELTIPKALKQQGYSTKKIGKVHHNGGPAEHPLDHGFDEFFGFIHHTWDYMRLSVGDKEALDERRTGAAKSATIGPLIRGRDEEVSIEDGFTTDIFTDEAIDFIERDHDQPFYLQLDYNAVHMPTYVAHPKYAERVGIEVPEWDRQEEDWKYPYWDPGVESWNDWHQRWGHLGEVDPLGRKRYLSHILALDENIGRLVKTLENKRLKENTLIVFLSDNGGTINTYANNQPLNGYKYMFGEGGIRIPIIFSMPGKLPSGKTIDGVVSAMDVFPTILELVGGKTPINLDGHSLVSSMKSDSSKGHEMLFWSNGKDFNQVKNLEEKNAPNWVVRKGSWKLIHSGGWTHTNFEITDGIAHPSPTYYYPKGTLLYNLEDDIGESKNLAERYPDLVAEMTSAYEEWKSNMVPPRNRVQSMSTTQSMLK